MALNGNEIIEKRNILNEVEFSVEKQTIKMEALEEIRKKNMTLQELRFFCIYLSKINARDASTRIVRFSLNDFQKIMELGRHNTKQLYITRDRLLSKLITIPTERGGTDTFHLFSNCVIDRDDAGQWFIEIDVHNKALPLLFDFKREYFTYELWNILKLKSTNQLRMYELLKQYEKVGERKMMLVELRKYLGIKEDDYPRWDNFKMRVIDGCQKALSANTDIKFTYEPIKAGRRVIGIKFFIEKNDRDFNQLSLDEFIEQQPPINAEFREVETAGTADDREEICLGFEDPIFDEFTKEQLEELRTMAWDNVNPAEVDRQNAVLNDITAAKEYAVAKYVTEKILMCNARGDRVKHRYAYIRRAVKDNYQ